MQSAVKRFRRGMAEPAKNRLLDKRKFTDKIPKFLRRVGPLAMASSVRMTIGLFFRRDGRFVKSRGGNLGEMASQPEEFQNSTNQISRR